MPKTPATTATVATTEACRGMLEELRSQHANLIGRQEEIAKERERLAGSALIDGSTRATRKLSELSREAVRITVELENMSAAIRTAEARLKAAEAREAYESEIAKAERARVLLAQRLELAEQVQKSMTEVNEIFEKIVVAGRELRKLSDRAPSDPTLAIVYEAMVANARFDLFVKKLLPSSPPSRSEMRVNLEIMVAHIDRGAQRHADTTIDGAADERKAA